MTRSATPSSSCRRSSSIARSEAWLLVFLGGCGALIPPHARGLPPGPAPEVRPPRSTLALATSVDLTPLREAIAGFLPATLEGEQPLGDTRLTWDLARDAIEVFAPRTVDGRIWLSTSAVGRVQLLRGKGERPCESNDVRLTLRVAARPGLSDGAEPALRFDDVKIEPGVDGQLTCKLGPVALAMSPKPLLDVVLSPIADGVARAVALLRIPMAGYLRPVMARLAEPRPLTVEGKPACLDLDARGLVLGQISGQGATLRIPLGVDVAPRLTLAACPTGAPPPPPLVLKNAPLGGDFRVTLAVPLAFADLDRRLAAAVVGKPIGNSGVILRGLTLAEADGHLLITAVVEGALRGTLYLWGQPHVVMIGGKASLQLVDFQFSFDSESQLQRLRFAAARALDRQLPSKLAAAARFDLSGPVDGMRAAIPRQLAVDPLAITLALEAVNPVGVQLHAHDLTLLVALRGTATAELTGARP